MKKNSRQLINSIVNSEKYTYNFDNYDLQGRLSIVLVNKVGKR